jgi:hypothetical protein
MENFRKELERVQSENESQLELMSSQMNAIKAKLCLYTAVGNNPTTLPPPDSIARGSSTESAETVNVRNICEMATPTHDVLINCNSGVHGNASNTNSANVDPTNSCLLYSEVPMPFFSDNSVSDIKLLEADFVSRGVPKQMQLAIALRSVTGPAARYRMI